MRSQFLTLLTVCALLPACGGDDEPKTNDDDTKNEVLTGAFIDGPVKGLHFVTATQSGLTNDTGEFTYLAGETVTFAVGGITLGTAAAKAQLTPFDLFGMTPPSTELTFKEAISNFSVTDFDRVANIAMLLMALDVDHDASNGLDLGSFDTQLAGASLSFDEDLSDFVFSGFERFAVVHPGVNRVPVTAPLLHLYASLGIAFTAHAQSSEANDDHGDLVLDRTSRLVFDDQGRTSSVITDRDADGDDDERFVYTYDAQGRYATESGQSDADDDNLSFESRSLTTTSYRDDGQEARHTDEQFDGDTLLSRSTTVLTYDTAGRRVREVIEEDTDANGSIENRYTTIYELDGEGRVSHSRFELDTGADGMAENARDHRYTYGTDGRIATDTQDDDTNNDGTPEGRVVTTLVFDTAGHLTKRTQDNYMGTTVLQSRRVSTLVFDAAGNFESSEVDIHTGPAATLTETTKTRDEYDANGRLVHARTEHDYEADGTPNDIVEYRYAYDPAGNQTSEVYEEDTDANGTYNVRTTTTRTFDDFHDMLSSTETTEGLPSATSARTFGYTEITGGLGYLVYRYAIN